MPTQPTTTWTREQVERMLATENLLYQRIELPYGLATEGKDRSPTARTIFPDDLTGKRVLDVGCFHGFFCHEALRRGASRVVGLEVDPDRRRRAEMIADCIGYPPGAPGSPEFRLFNIERESLDETFDYVICLNVTHHFKNPLAVLEKLADATRERLVLEIAGFGKHDRPKLMIGRLGAWFMRRTPVLLAAPTGTNGRGITPKFVISPSAIENILCCHRNTFSRVDTAASEFKDRFITIAHKRRVRKLVVVGGPPAVGKSVMIEKMRAGGAPAVAEAMGVDPRGTWESVEATRLQRISEPRVDTLVFHYNFLNPYNTNTKRYELDEFLDIIGLSDRVTFVTPWVDPKRLYEQFMGIKIEPMTRGERFVGAPRNKVLEREYQDPAKIVEYYRRWFEFTRTRGVNHVVTRGDGDDYRTMTIEQWEQITGNHASRA